MKFGQAQMILLIAHVSEDRTFSSSASNHPTEMKRLRAHETNRKLHDCFLIIPIVKCAFYAHMLSFLILQMKHRLTGQPKLFPSVRSGFEDELRIYLGIYCRQRTRVT